MLAGEFVDRFRAHNIKFILKGSCFFRTGFLGVFYIFWAFKKVGRVADELAFIVFLNVAGQGTNSFFTYKTKAAVNFEEIFVLANSIFSHS